jgi:hypothetical protein
MLLQIAVNLLCIYFRSCGTKNPLLRERVPQSGGEGERQRSTFTLTRAVARPSPAGEELLNAQANSQ